MNRKLIIGGLVATALSLFGFLACNTGQPNEGCALESGANYWAKYVITSQSGNCNFLATYDPTGALITDGNGNWVSGESIAVAEFGPDQGPITVQFTPQSLALDLPDGGFAIGTLGTIQLNGKVPTVCDIATVSPSGQILGDPNFGVSAPPAGSNPGHHPEDAEGAADAGTAGSTGSSGSNTSSTGSSGSSGSNTSSTASSGSSAGSTGGTPGSTGSSGSSGQSVAASSGSSGSSAAAAGSSGSSAAAGSTGTVAAGSSGSSGSGSSGSSGSAGSASSASASAASASASGGGAGPVVVTYTFSNVAFQEAYSILGKQFSATLNYTQVPVDPALAMNTDPTAGPTYCNATIDVEAVTYNDYAAGQPGHLEGNHCEQDTNGDQTDCTAHSSTFGFPVSTGWSCQPFGNQNFISLLIANGALAPEEYADGGTSLPDGGLIPFQRCVPATPVPVGALND